MPDPQDKLPQGTPIGTDEQGNPIHEVDASAGSILCVRTSKGFRELGADELEALAMLDDEDLADALPRLRDNPDARAFINEDGKIEIAPVIFTMTNDQPRRHGIISYR